MPVLQEQENKSPTATEEAAAIKQPGEARPLKAAAARKPLLPFLKPVPKGKRFICYSISAICALTVIGTNMDTPITVKADGVHVVEITRPGNYLAFFRGDVRDPYGWG